MFSTVSAQISKGKISLEGAIGFGNSKTTSADKLTKTTTTSFIVHPQIGYFFIDGLESYVFGTYGTSKTKTGNESTNGEVYGAGVGARKYFRLADNFSFLAGPQFSFSKTKDQDRSVIKTTDIGLYGGFIFFPRKNMGIRAGLGGLGFSHSTLQEEGKTGSAKNSSFGLNGNTANISLGLSFYL